MRKQANVFILAVVSFSAILIGCSKIDPDPPRDYFTQWNSCAALTALQEYVQDVTNPSSVNYIKPEDRIATFDMDGTFVGELRREAKWREAGYIVISMKNDFKTIYGENVKKTAFTF